MSLVELRVELPAYSHSFLIQVPSSSLIIDVKQEIFKSCVGAPRVEGQRVIWRGRHLVDNEKVEDLWKSPDEPRIVHLAVHPTAWSSTPPEIQQPPTVVPVTQPHYTLRPPQPRAHAPMHSAPVLPDSHPLGFVQHMHQNAILALTQNRTITHNNRNELDAARVWAVHVVERIGWTWPAILNEEFPSATEGGLVYENVTVEGHSYLSLRNPSETPTPLQIHALKVLTYTFTLITLPNPNSAAPHFTPSHQMLVPPHVNMILQQLGLPPLRVAQNQNPNQNRFLPDLRDIPFRPLLALAMILLRTLLLLYFVVPARKPIFGLLLVAWMAYEGWRPVRDAFRRGMGRPAAQVNPPARPRPGQNAQPEPGQRPPVHGQGRQTSAIDSVANINLQSEERDINPAPGTIPEEPSLGHKIVTFFSLLLLTIHPAAWNRRRESLRRREERLRMEANTREAANPPGEGEDDAEAAHARELIEQHDRRPLWVRNYVERVDWMDETD